MESKINEAVNLWLDKFLPLMKTEKMSAETWALIGQTLSQLQHNTIIATKRDFDYDKFADKCKDIVGSLPQIEASEVI